METNYAGAFGRQVPTTEALKQDSVSVCLKRIQDSLTEAEKMSSILWGKICIIDGAPPPGGVAVGEKPTVDPQHIMFQVRQIEGRLDEHLTALRQLSGRLDNIL